MNFNWKMAIIFLIVAAGLVILTGSFAMSLGILLLLLVIDQLLAQWDKRIQRKRQEKMEEERAEAEERISKIGSEKDKVQSKQEEQTDEGTV